MLFPFLLGGCMGSIFQDGKVRDMSEHFWTNVNGDYQSEQTGLILKFNRANKSVQARIPVLQSMDDLGQPQCSLVASAAVGFIGNDGSPLFSCFIGNDLLLKMSQINISLEYAKNVDQVDMRVKKDCERAQRQLGYVPNEAYLSISGYSPTRLIINDIKVPSFFGCESAMKNDPEGLVKYLRSQYHRLENPLR